MTRRSHQNFGITCKGYDPQKQSYQPERTTRLKISFEVYNCENGVPKEIGFHLAHSKGDLSPVEIIYTSAVVRVDNAASLSLCSLNSLYDWPLLNPFAVVTKGICLLSPPNKKGFYCWLQPDQAETFQSLQLPPPKCAGEKITLFYRGLLLRKYGFTVFWVLHRNVKFSQGIP